MGTSMGVGRDAGKSLALGIATGSLLWGLLAWGGLTTVLVAYASLITIIKIAGAAYLLWLAYKSFRSALSARDIKANALSLSGGASAYYRRGLLIQMTNPKAALTWTATISLGLALSARLDRVRSGGRMPPVKARCGKIDDDARLNLRPMELSDSPRCHRPHISDFCLSV